VCARACACVCVCVCVHVLSVCACASRVHDGIHTHIHRGIVFLFVSS